MSTYRYDGDRWIGMCANESDARVLIEGALEAKRLRTENAKLVAALSGLVAANVRWNEAVEGIIGRQVAMPGTA